MLTTLQEVRRWAEQRKADLDPDAAERYWIETQAVNAVMDDLLQELPKEQ